jgi:hypothetical protein
LKRTSAELDVGAEALEAHVDLGVPPVGALEALTVEDRCGVGHTWLRLEALGDLVDAGHLRHPLRMGEGADGDHLGARLAERVEQAQLLRHRDVGALDLQPLPHRVVRDLHGLGQGAHVTTLSA